MASTVNTPRDPNTLSNYNHWRTAHTTTSFEILFDKQKLRGCVVHKLKSITDSETKEIILDSSYLDISEVQVDGKSAEWNLLPRVEPYGAALKVQLKKGVPLNETIELSIVVSTTKSCTALQWLTPAQTSNKKHPYMFSQCQAIHARSIFPCQDTPDVKATFDFNIKSTLPVVASGLPASSNPISPSSEPQLYKFQQQIPVPTYLFALASGDIAIASIGPRCIVATGPDELNECKWELEEDTERFLQAAESIVYPYAWGKYGVLILPPSFPYGGMENPVFTFATPTIISGDRQNIDVIAHEMSHSWSGNLVSNASWEHFWLNEGWTTYLERRIEASIHGDDAWRDFSSIIGWNALTDSINQFGEDHEFTKLVIDLKGKDPDDAFSSIPYEKGFNFLYFIEKLIGKEEFDKFIPYYFTKWKGKSLDSYDFKATLLEFFEKDIEVSKKLNDGIDWDAWFYKPGFPPKPDFDTKLVDVVYELADGWEAFTKPEGSGFVPTNQDVVGLSANQIVVFLEKCLLFENPLPAQHVVYMGFIYRFKTSKNVEVSSRYYQLVMKAGVTGILGEVVDLLGKVGRMKFVRPLFSGLIKLDRDLAVNTYEKYKDFYHPICRQMVAKELFGRTEG
jgi:leukotriene-A4 hydrolase